MSIARTIGLLAIASLLYAAVTEKDVSLRDIPAPLQSKFPDLEATVRNIRRQTDRRLTLAKNNSLVYFVLRSSRFTTEPRVDPAAAAKELQQTGRIPQVVHRRIEDFLNASTHLDARIDYFASELHPDRKLIESNFARVMQDVAGRRPEQAASSDRILTIESALGALKARDSALRIDRVLVVDPTLDYEPDDPQFSDFPAQSLEPFAIADALLDNRISDTKHLRIQCLSADPQVVAAFTYVGNLHVLPSRGSEDYLAALRKLGSNIGERQGNELRIRPDIARTISTEQLNIAVEHLAGRQFDLVVAMNLPSDPRELILSLANITAMLRPGGHLMSNSVPELDNYTKGFRLESVSTGNTEAVRIFLR